MSADEHAGSPPDPERPFTDLLTYTELLTTPPLARLYVYVLEHGPVEIEAVKRDLEMPHSTAYKYVGTLEEMGVLRRNDDETPATITVDSIRLEIETDHGDLTATPTLIDAIGRQLENDDIRVFVDRQGVAKLAAAVHYAYRVLDGDLTQRTAAKRLDVHPVEGMTVITALLDVVEDARVYDPYSPLEK